MSFLTILRNRRLLAPAIVALLSLTAGKANALCTVVCSCAVTTTNVVFGSINPLSLSSTDSAGGVSVTCGGVAGLLIPLQIDISAGGSGGFSTRTMSNGSYRLNYNLYKDSAYATVFGDTTNGTVDATSSIGLNALGVGPTVTIPIYGRVFGAQTTMAPGVYSDTIAVTLTYY